MIMLRQETAFILEITSGERINSFEMSWWSCLNLLKTWKSQKSHHHSFWPKKVTFPKLAQNNVWFFLLPCTTIYWDVLPYKKFPKIKNVILNWNWKFAKKIRLTKMVVQWTKDATLTDNHCGSRLWSLGWIRDVFL